MDTLDFALRVVIVLKGINELVLLTLIGQGALWLLAGSSRHTNLIYGAFNIVGARVFRFFRRLTPQLVLDRHIPFVAVFWLLLIELALIIAKIYLVAETVAASAG